MAASCLCPNPESQGLTFTLSWRMGNGYNSLFS